MSARENEAECLTIRLWPDAACLLGVGRNSIYEAAARGELPVIKRGKRLLVSRKALVDMVNEAKPRAA